MDRYYDRSTAPLSWHWFTSRIRTPFTAIVEIITFLLNAYMLAAETYTSGSGLLLIDCFVSMMRSLVLGFAIYGLIKYEENGVKLYFIDYAIQLIYYLYVLIVAPSYGLVKSYNKAKYGLPAVILLVVLEGIYYYKRYPLFSHCNTGNNMPSDEPVSRVEVTSNAISAGDSLPVHNSNISEQSNKGSRMFCRYCGGHIDDSSSTCRHCGASLSLQSGNAISSLPSEKDRNGTNSATVNSNYASGDIAEELRKYKKLLDEGLITQGDYDKKKEQILSMY